VRFFVDHCVPAEVADHLRDCGHEAWTAYDAHLEEGSDDELIVYAASKDAIAVTINRDFVTIARRVSAARVVHLRVEEAYAVEAMSRALEWFDANHLPGGRVLRVFRHAPLQILTPLPW
jgi:predicted nuclease of predicted toxin-antitoxin system